MDIDKNKTKDWMISDLHIHSKFSRACSKDLDFPNLVKWARIKGINLLGTGDFSHPKWFEEIKSLKHNGKGFYYYEDFPFIITGEISLIYSDKGKGRKVHLILLIPSIEIAEKIHAYLDSKGRRDYDGRPIFGIPCDVFTRDIKEISKDIEIIPGHCLTPYFGVFGSMSGFDSLKDCFKEQTDNIHAIETGISANPEMLWHLSFLNPISILSFSDSHSFWPFRLGREATIFKKTDSYLDLISQIRNNTLIGTIETDPAYGKYHWDGHMNCKFSCSSEKTKQINGICPICNSKLVIGVENRVNELKNTELFKGKDFYTLLPLHEIISLFLDKGMQSKVVFGIYNSFISYFENEFNILLNVSKKEMLEKGFDEKLVNLIIRNREGKIKVIPGYDGQYGVASLEDFVEKQVTLL